MERFGLSSKLNIQAPFSKLVRRATSLLQNKKDVRPPPLDGEIVYSKNNVCVHLSGQRSDEGPIPGYLTLRCVGNESFKSTLMLCWVPNQTLRSISQGPVQSSTPKQQPHENGNGKLPAARHKSAPSSFPNVLMTDERLIVSIDNANNEDSRSILSLGYSSQSSSSTTQTNQSERRGSPEGCSSPSNDIQFDTGMRTSVSNCSFHSKRQDSTDSKKASRPNSLRFQESDDTSISSGSTGGPDSQASSPDESVNDDSPTHLLTGTAERWAQSHNLIFPQDSIEQKSRLHDIKQAPKASVFQVNLGQMRSLRLFYSEDSTTCGQLVIASRESQYKIFHFYSGGLDKLAEILEEWNLFQNPHQQNQGSPFSQQFRVVKPNIQDESEFHPDERLYEMVTPEIWKGFMNEHGQIINEMLLKKSIFFGGLQSSLRSEVWPFLLHLYPYNSTFEQREEIRNDKYLKYQSIRKRREKLMRDRDWRDHFWRTVQNTVEKDVVRTDRSNTFYRGENNPNVELLKEILLNYAMQHPKLGYTQGMSDLLAPLLHELKSESDAYWCFTGLMQRTIFVSSPRDHDMDRQLLYLKELLRILHAPFYQHLMKVGEGVGMLFVHRWILLCFKREFSDKDSMCIWESCWTNLQTDYFHLFVAVAIITSYSDDVITQDLPADEMLLHFSSLSNHMNGKIMLRKARGLMHQFRLLERIPCTLQGLCSMCPPDIWDSNHAPAVECVSHPLQDGCPYLASPSSHSDFSN